MPDPLDPLLAALRAATGENGVSIEEADRAAHSHDSCPAAAKWTAEEKARHTPRCVVRPRRTEEVAAVLRAAAAHGAAVVPYGAGSGVVGAAVPSAQAVSVDLRSMPRIDPVDGENWLLRAEAGALGSAVEAAANAAGFTLGHYPQSLHISTVGGWVATAATGTFSSKYGGIEDILHALEVVLPDGEVVTTRPIARTSAGPRLQQLFIGSEGTLGVITRVTLRLQPLPEARRFRGVLFPDMRAGLAAVRALFRRHLVPAVVRLYEPKEAAGLCQAAGVPGGRVLLLLGVEGAAALAAAQEELALAVAAQHGGEDAGAAIGELWEKHRFNAQWLDDGNAGDGRMADAIDVSAAWSALPRLYETMMRTLAPLTASLWAHFSHFTAHGGSIYFIVFIEGGTAAETRRRYDAAWAAAMQVVQEAGGSIAHHHGTGLLRLPWLERELDGELTLLRRLKTALDPAGLLNPGKLLLGQPPDA
jgi:alkyldihydroxyacetonephosphate synthase